MGSVSSKPPDAAKANDAAASNNLIWIISSMKAVLPYLLLESILCLHNVSKLLVWNIHNLRTWRFLCLRDFPNYRSKFHERVILCDSSATASTSAILDADLKTLYFELFCQRFVMEAEIRLHSHCTGHISQQLHELTRHGEKPIPITFKAQIGTMPTAFPSFPVLAPTETSSLTLEWIPRPGVELSEANMGLLRRAFAFMAYQLGSDPKDGPIQPGSGTKGDAPRVVMSRGTTAEGDPVVVSSFNYQNGSETWKRTPKGCRGAFKQVWKLFKRHVLQHKKSKTKNNNYGDAAQTLLKKSRFMFAMLSFLRKTRHLRRQARKRRRKTGSRDKRKVREARVKRSAPLELKLHLTEKMLSMEVRGAASSLLDSIVIG